jgi:glycosyltransferase involved in cell wall biosynthesis
LVTVVIPVFNRAELLPEAVASVLAQSYPLVEVVIVDDGSSDNSCGVAQALADATPEKIRVFRQANAGPGAARNHGLRHAHGEFIQYLDSDDLLEPRKFEWQVQALLDDPGAGVAYGLTQRVDLSTGRSRPWARTGEPIGDIFPSFLMKRGWDTNSPLWRRSVCDRIGEWAEFRCMEDWEHDLRAGMEGVRPVQVRGHVATVRDHGGDRASGMQSGFTPALTSDVFRANSSIWKRMRARGLTDWSYLEEFSRKLFWISRMCGERGLLAEADEALAMADEMVATRHFPWEMRRFRALKNLLGWPRAIALGEAVRSPLRRRQPGQQEACT